MTEHRLPYRAKSWNKQQLYLASSRKTSRASSLQQDKASGSTSQEIIFFIPILQLPQKSGNTCLCHIHLDDGNPGVCNTPTEQQCPSCGCFVCEDHQSPDRMLLTSDTGEEYSLPLCDTCAHLPIQTVYALRAFRQTINEREGLG
jgi:hypothetical protein